MRNIVFAATLGLASASCVAPYVAITPRMMNLDIDGQVSASTTGASAFTDVEALGYDEDSGIFSPRLELGWAGAHLAVDNFAAGYSGQGTLSGEIDLGGVTLPANEPVTSSVDLDVSTLRFTGDLVPGSNFDLGIGAGVALIDLQGSFTSLNTLETASTDETLPVPLLAGRAAVRLGDLALTGDVGWMSIDYDGDEISYSDFDVGLRYSFLSAGGRMSAGIVVGYRSVDAEGNYDDDSTAVDFDLALCGPYLGVVLSL